MSIGAVIFPRAQAEAYLAAVELAERRFQSGTLHHERSAGQWRRLRIASHQPDADAWSLPEETLVVAVE